MPKTNIEFVDKITSAVHAADPSLSAANIRFTTLEGDPLTDDNVYFLQDGDKIFMDVVLAARGRMDLDRDRDRGRRDLDRDRDRGCGAACAAGRP